MAARTTSYRKSGRSSYSGSRVRSYRYGYQYGSEAPAIYPGEEYEQPRRRSARDQERIARSARNRAAQRRRTAIMNLAMIGFIAAAVSLMCLVLFSYISLQAQVTQSVEDIASYESQLQSLKAANDQEYNEIVASIDLDEIKERAMTDLGMDYAAQDQIVTYEGDVNDYVHQVQEVTN